MSKIFLWIFTVAGAAVFCTSISFVYIVVSRIGLAFVFGEPSVATLTLLGIILPLMVVCAGAMALRGKKVHTAWLVLPLIVSLFLLKILFRLTSMPIIDYVG